MAKANLRSVAARAGVSVSTVSNAYNRPDQLSVEVREKIFAVARELGYAGPHPAARSLRTRRVGAIGVMFSTPLEYVFSDPYCIELMRGMSEVLASHRTDLVLIPQADVESARQAVVDGVIADGLDDTSPAIQAVLERGLPVALSTESTHGHCAVIDDLAAGRLVGEHLAERAATKVAIVVGARTAAGAVTVDPDPDILHTYSRLRAQGITQGLGRGATVEVVAVGGNTVSAGAAAAQLILDAQMQPHAIAADSDVLAAGIAQALTQRGLAPGVDVAVTGFDDLDIAAHAGITSVRQPIREKGRVLANALLQPHEDPTRTLLDTALVPRASTLDRDTGEHGASGPTEASTAPVLPSQLNEEWAVNQLDLYAYLARIGYQGNAQPNLTTLRALHRAHIATIPFENLDVLLGRAVSVDLADIELKLVYRRRGGYCYEQNLLMAAALERLGYRVNRFLARVGDPDDGPRPRSHLVLTVELDGQAWLVDVGFGSGLLEPLSLEQAGAVSQGVWTFDISRDSTGAWQLRELRGGKWTTRYIFREEPVHLVDVEGANFITSHSPQSPFVQRPILVGRDQNLERALIGLEFKTADAHSDLSSQVVSGSELPAVVGEHFGLRLGTDVERALIALWQ